MRVDSSYPLQIGTDLDIAFVIPETGEIVAGTGQVVRLAGPGSYGVRFYGLEGGGSDQIQAFVESLAAKQP
jgi:hypothetical protein